MYNSKYNAYYKPDFMVRRIRAHGCHLKTVPTNSHVLPGVRSVSKLLDHYFRLHMFWYVIDRYKLVIERCDVLRVQMKILQQHYILRYLYVSCIINNKNWGCDDDRTLAGKPLGKCPLRKAEKGVERPILERAM
jgi:hypothetical protein